MKKLISLLSLIGVLVVSGCSCSKTGEYEFESITLKVGETEKTYKCNDLDERSPDVMDLCNDYDDIDLILTKNGKLITQIEDDEVSQDFYKIEDGKLYVRKTESDEYKEFGKYKRGRITIEKNGVKIVFKKD